MFYLKNLLNPWRIGLTIVLIFIATMYGRLFGELTNKVASGEVDFLSAERITDFAILAIIIFIFIRMVFPGYSPMQLIFPKYFPLSVMQRYFVSVLSDFYKPYFFYISVFIISGSYALENSRLDFLYLGFLTLLFSIFLRRCVQYLLDFDLKIYGRLVPILVLIVAYFYWFYPHGILSFNKISLPLFTAILFFVGYFQEIAIIGNRNPEVSNRFGKNIIGLKLLFNNKKARLPLAIGFFLKAIILLIDLFLYKTKGSHLFEEGQIIFWLLASPLIVFTYVFNNFWGFYGNLWLNMELRIGNYKSMITQFIRLLSLTLMVDMIISLTILWFSWNNYLQTLLFYFTSAIYLVLLSFLWSLITPRRVNTIFQMKGSCSPLSNITAVGGILLLSVVRVNSLLYVLIPVYLIIGGIAYWICLSIYNEKKYLIFNRIFQE